MVSQSFNLPEIKGRLHNFYGNVNRSAKCGGCRRFLLEGLLSASRKEFVSHLKPSLFFAKTADFPKLFFQGFVPEFILNLSFTFVGEAFVLSLGDILEHSSMTQKGRMPKC